jgi:hypothetical protein
MEEYRTNVGQGLGIVGLVFGIISTMICFIPCVGILAIVPGIIGITFSAIAYNQASRGNGARGVIIAALVISILGSSIALLQGLGFSYLKNRHGDVFDKIEKNIEEENNNVDETFEEAGDDMERVLEQLESSDDSIHIDIKIGKKLSDEEFNNFLRDYEKLIQKTADLSQKSKNGEQEAVVHYSKLALKLAAIHAKMIANIPNLTAEQRKKLEEINKKYEKDINNLTE